MKLLILSPVQKSQRKAPAEKNRAIRVIAVDKSAGFVSGNASHIVQLGRMLMLHLSASTTSGFPVQQQSQALIMERVRGEFREMPGLALTLAQAGKLWSLDAETCAETLNALVGSGFLNRRADGAFCRVSDLNSRSSKTAHA